MSITHYLITILLTAFITSVNAAMPTGLPQDFNALVKSADLIFIGKFSRVSQKGLFFGYKENGEAQLIDEDTIQYLKRNYLNRDFKIDGRNVGKATIAGLPFVDYELVVDEILMDDTAATFPNQLIYRMQKNYMWLEKKGKRLTEDSVQRLFILKRNPDNRSYNAPTVMHRLNIEQPVLKLPVHNQRVPETQRLPFGKSWTANEFVNQVRQAVVERREKSINLR